jgi:tellurite resistance protein TerC
MQDPIWWAAFLGLIFAVLAIDLGLFHRKAHSVGMREALTWCAVWISLALCFNLGIYLGWIGDYAPEARRQASLEFLTGYLVEWSLSVDNVFVFALLFSYFRVPDQYQHRILFWGILGALIMRGILIFAGIALINTFGWIIYVFGAILIFSGIKMWLAKDQQFDPGKNPALKLIRRMFPVTQELHGQRFFVKAPIGPGGRTIWAATPLFVVLVFVEWSDVVFAVDSIPAILAITRDPFIVLTSNMMALLGLRSLYFALAGVMRMFHLLHYGLSLLLVFIGVKMLLAHTAFKIPTLVSLGVVAGILVLSVVASLVFPPRRDEEAHGTTGSPAAIHPRDL